MSWKCGKCNKIYTTEQFVKLARKPWKQQSTPVCECGYTFLKDRWSLRDDLTIVTEFGPIDVVVSTVFLEFEHPGGFYETMLFPKGKIKCLYQERYYTQEQAERGHKEILARLLAGKFEI